MLPKHRTIEHSKLRGNWYALVSSRKWDNTYQELVLKHHTGKTDPKHCDEEELRKLLELLNKGKG